MGVLKGPRAKLERAQTQAEALNREIKLRLNPESGRVEAEFEVKTYPAAGERVLWQILVRVGEMGRELPDDFGLRLGEALHNFRGCLDHAVWRLVGRSKVKLTARQAKGVQFPMAKTRADYWNRVGDRLPGISSDLRTLIEQYQPYRQTWAGRYVRYLRTLTDIDKHRTLLVTPNHTAEGKFELRWSGGEKIYMRQRIKAGGQIKRGTEIGYLVLSCPAGQKPKVSVDGSIDAGAAFPARILRSTPVSIRSAYLWCLKGSPPPARRY